MAYQVIIPGVDLTVLPCIDSSAVTQAIAAAVFNTAGGIGGVIYSDSAPDVVTYPQFATFIWMETAAGAWNGSIYGWDGSTWQLFLFDGSKLIDGTVTLDKLALSGASAYFIIQRNAANTEWVAVSIPNALQTASIALDKLVNGTSGNKLLTSLAGVNSFETVDSIAALFSNGSIPASKITPHPTNTQVLVCIGGLSQFAELAAFFALTPAESIPISGLSGSTLLAGQSIRRNSANNGWEPTSFNSVAVILDVKSSGTDGGSFTSGSQVTRDLNTIQSDPGSIIDNVTSSQIQVAQAGTYLVEASAPAVDVDSHQIYLVKITGGPTNVATGSSEFADAGDAVQTRSTISAIIVAAEDDVFEIQHRCGTTNPAANARGDATGFGDEVYTFVKFTKLA